MRVINRGEEGRGILIENDGYILNDRGIITEGQSIEFDKKRFYDEPILHCVLQKYGLANGNGRIYKKEVLEKAVSYYLEHVKIRAAVGAVDHVDNTTISLMNIGLLIEDYYWDGATLVGKVRLPISRGYKEIGVESNPADKIANLILEHNINIGISSRGVGDVKKDKNITYVTEYNIICWDFVQMPSTKGAWMYTQEEDIKKHIEGVPNTPAPNLNPSKFEKLAKAIR